MKKHNHGNSLKINKPTRKYTRYWKARKLSLVAKSCIKTMRSASSDLNPTMSSTQDNRANKPYSDTDCKEDANDTSSMDEYTSSEQEQESKSDNQLNGKHPSSILKDNQTENIVKQPDIKKESESNSSPSSSPLRDDHKENSNHDSTAQLNQAEAKQLSDDLNTNESNITATDSTIKKCQSLKQIDIENKKFLISS